MQRLIIATLIGFTLGGLVRPSFDEMAYSVSDPAPIAFDARLDEMDACERAEIAPTDANLEACFGPMV